MIRLFVWIPINKRTNKLTRLSFCRQPQRKGKWKILLIYQFLYFWRNTTAAMMKLNLINCYANVNEQYNPSNETFIFIFLIVSKNRNIKIFLTFAHRSIHSFDWRYSLLIFVNVRSSQAKSRFAQNYSLGIRVFFSSIIVNTYVLFGSTWFLQLNVLN